MTRQTQKRKSDAVRSARRRSVPKRQQLPRPHQAQAMKKYRPHQQNHPSRRQQRPLQQLYHRMMTMIQMRVRRLCTKLRRSSVNVVLVRLLDRPLESPQSLLPPLHSSHLSSQRSKPRKLHRIRSLLLPFKT